MRLPSCFFIETRRRSRRQLINGRQRSPRGGTATRRRVTLFVVAIIGFTVLAACGGRGGQTSVADHHDYVAGHHDHNARGGGATHRPAGYQPIDGRTTSGDRQD